MSFLNSSRLGAVALLCTAGLVLSSCADEPQNTTGAQPTAEPTVATATATAPEPSASTPTKAAKPSPAASKSASAPASEKPAEAPAPAATEDGATNIELATPTPESPAKGTVETVAPQPQPEPEESSASTQPAPANPSPEESTQSSTTAAGTDTCDYGQIHVMAEVANGGGAAGSRYINISFTNSGDSPCSINGYPGVNYVDSAGNQIGATANHAAEWTSTGKVLAPGESSSATLRETRAGLFDAETCQPETAAGYRVTIPGTSGSYILNFPAEACSNMSNAQLSVGQVGAQS